MRNRESGARRGNAIVGSLFTHRCVAATVALALAVTACGGDASQDDGALDYYDGSTFTFLIPSAPGGLPDITGRFLSDWLPRYMEGDMTVVLEHMPGGGHVIAMNHYEQQVPRDGLTAMIMSTTSHMAWRFGLPALEADLATYEPLMTVGGGHLWIARRDAGIDGLNDLVSGAHGPLYGSGQTLGSSDLFKTFPFFLLDIPLEITWGYDGTGETTMAFERGEANVDIQSSAAYPLTVTPFLESGMAVELFSMGQLTPDGDLVRDPFWPDIPHIGEVYEMKFGEAPSGPMWDAVILGGVLARTLGRTLWIHGDAPEEALAALRHGLEQMVADPEFLAAAEEALGEYPPTVGQESRDLVQNLLIDIDPGLIEYLVEFVLDTYDYDLREA